ncbi:MAG: hypothetical protein II781_04695 [Clostridia bacterium]|nr:hypothetical protein [Clostridia bacterium]
MTTVKKQKASSLRRPAGGNRVFPTRKILCVCLCSVWIALVLTGCFPVIDETGPGIPSPLPQPTAGTAEMPAETAGSPAFPVYLENTELEKLAVRAAVQFPDGFDGTRKVSVSSAKPAAWDRDRIVEALAGGRRVENRFSGENTGPDDLYHVCEFEDGADLTFYSGQVLYTTPAGTEYEYSYYFDYYEDYWGKDTLRNAFPAAGIDGLEKSDAIDSAGHVTSLLGLDGILGEPQVYAMDAASVNRLQDELDVRDKHGSPAERWAADQEAYLIVYPVLYQDIPSLYVGSATGENEMLTSSKAWFIYGRDGWVEFEVSGIFEIEGTLSEAPILSPEEAVGRIKQSFENIIMDREIEISSLQLAYVIRENTQAPADWKVEPVWLVRGEYKGTPPSGSNPKGGAANSEYLALISAVNGTFVPIFAIGG